MNESVDAFELLRRGRLAEAEQAFEKILASRPTDVEALNIVALGALRKGDPQRAVVLLRQAAQAAPTRGITHHHLGSALEACGDLSGALSAYETAVRHAPDLDAARLQLARCLRRSGSPDRALVQFARALESAQAKGRWLNAETTPAPLRPAVEEAVSTVRAGRHAMLERLLAPLIQRYGRAELARVEQCIRIYLREEPAPGTDERQQPSFLFFPGLPASPYLQRDLFPWIDAFEQQTSAIRAELEKLLPSASGRERVFTTDELERLNLRGEDVAPSWNGYYFYRHGIRREDNCAQCPVTADALGKLPLTFIRAHGPEVLYSVFTPGTHLLPHRGVTNTRLVGHLPLIVPEHCALNVGGEIHEWQEGRVVVFDDTYEHEAWNRSGSTRVILIFDIWNPHLTDIERAAVTDLVIEIGEFRERVAAA